MRLATAVVLMAAFAPSLGVECVGGQEMETVQMACCVATGRDSHGEAEDGCERAEQERLVTQIEPLGPPPAVLPIALPALVPPPDTYVGPSVVSTAELKAPSPPTYVLLGSLLI